MISYIKNIYHIIIATIIHHEIYYENDTKNFTKRTTETSG